MGWLAIRPFFSSSGKKDVIALNQLFHNVLAVQDGYPCRLTERQRAWYCAQSREFADRANCTAGVSLRFLTDATVLRFSYEVISYCRSRNVCDLFENGVHTASVRLADMQSRGEAVFTRETVGEAEIEIMLPNTCGLRIKEICFGEWKPASKPEKKLLILGDSILQGINTYHPSCTLGNLLAHGLDVEIVNQSVGGARFVPELLEELDFDPHSILVALGANDAFSGDLAYEQTIPAYFKRLKELYPDKPITAVTPVFCMKLKTDAALAKRFDAVRALIKTEAEKNGVRVIDGDPLVPHTAKFFNEDGTHPNDLGFMQYALNLTALL